ncbi:MAG: hypothetical protein K2X77_27320 [Candidatus Obscuribacterales bacterium]|nr:hypothetical protein [Candidatus Obscuribacterales bacterium]
MGARTLRILISFALVFGVFLYLASLQLKSLVPEKSEEEGILGGPIPGLTRWQLAKFKEGKELFQKNFTAQEGLGPVYNGQSCASCHGGTGIAGGGGQDPRTASITWFAKRVTNGRFAKEQPKAIAAKMELKDEDFMPNDGGPILLKKSISTEFKDSLGLAADCKIDAATEVPKQAEFQSKRFAPPLFGLGLVNAVPDPAFDFFAGQQLRDLKSAVRGKPAHLAPYLWGWAGNGKFGMKCQEPTLFSMTAFEMSEELGLTTPILPQSRTSKAPDAVPECMKTLAKEPNFTVQEINKLQFYLNTLGAPQAADVTPESQMGYQVFDKLGCGSCHLPAMETIDKVFMLNPDAEPWKMQMTEPGQGAHGPNVTLAEDPKYFEIKALEKQRVLAYSDFLLHDMGPALQDGIAQGSATGSEWRTTPLWGLRHKSFYLHDGRTKKLEEAIALHGGQAAKHAAEFKKLSDKEKANLLAFLRSL